MLLHTVSCLEKIYSTRRHHARHRGNGPNNDEERAMRYLANDPRFEKVRQIITEGGHIDTPPDFVRIRRTAPFRHVQLLQIYIITIA